MASDTKYTQPFVCAACGKRRQFMVTRRDVLNTVGGVKTVPCGGFTDVGGIMCGQVYKVDVDTLAVTPVHGQ